MHNQEQQILLPHALLESLFEHVGDEIEALQVTIGTIIQGFFHLEKKSDISFSDITDSEYLEKLFLSLSKVCERETHKYKKLHYILILSKIRQQLHLLKFQIDLDNKWGNMLHVLHPGDILLLSYEANGSWLNKAFNKTVSTMLQVASGSIFSHVGIIGNSHEDGYDWIHSTLDNSGGRSGVKKESLQQYIEKRTPLSALVVRPSYMNDTQKETFLSQAYYYVEQQVEYDTGDAVSDILGLDLWRKEERFNCGELVYACIKSVIDGFSPNKRSIPVSYLLDDHFSPIYLTQF